MSKPLETTPTGEILVDPRLIKADPNQPRRQFSPESIQELMESIAAVGLIEPLVVVLTPDKQFRLVTGERRLRACLMGLKHYPDNPHFQKVPVRIRQHDVWDDMERVRVQLDENRVRENLQPTEIAQTYRNAKLLREIALAEKALLEKGEKLPHYPDGATPIQKQRKLKPLLRKRNIPWPTVSWTAVFKSLGQPLDRRVLAVLRVPTPVLKRCDELGLTKTATAALSSLNDETLQMKVLDIVAQYKDRSLLTQMVDLLQADPNLTPEAALAMIQKTRSLLTATGEKMPEPAVKADSGKRVPIGQEEYGELVRSFEQLIDRIEAHDFTKYQVGSLKLLLERAAKALPHKR